MEQVNIPSYMTARQADLLRETMPEQIEGLDEDALLELHLRVRRARDKYVKLYRRRGAALVDAKGGRGAARPASRTAAGKAEVFELALARVSARVDVVARAAAEELREARIAAARPAAYPEVDPASGGGPTDSGRVPRARKTTGGLKRDASSRSAGARRQARRDAR